MNEQLKDLIKMPFKVYENDFGEFSIRSGDKKAVLHVGGINHLGKYDVDFADFTAAALNEKADREWGEPLRWVWKKQKPAYETELEEYYNLICPQCGNDISGTCSDPENYDYYENYCPNCGKKLNPPIL